MSLYYILDKPIMVNLLKGLLLSLLLREDSWGQWAIVLPDWPGANATPTKRTKPPFVNNVVNNMLLS